MIWFFDCDGVLLDSNRVKTEAFRTVSLPYGQLAADQVVEHHLAHGGQSRHVKLTRLFDEILGRSPEPGELENLLERFAAESRAGLAAAAVDPDAHALLEELRARNHPTYVVSGGLESEVRWVLNEVGLADSFDGIYGSPREKRDIVADVLTRTGRDSGVVIGDSRLDLDVADSCGLHGVFVRHWSEFAGWEEYVSAHPSITVVEDLGELRRSLDGPVGPGRSGEPWLR